MNKLQKMEPTVDPNAQALALQSVDATIVDALISKAVDSKAAVEVIKELRAMRLDDQRRAAKSAFDAALSRFQAECPTIIKTRSVENTYKYAPIEDVEAAIRPVERAHGFSHTFNQDVQSQNGWVICIVTIRHTAGHEQETVSKFPLGTKTRLMSDTQQYAAALTFANRRTLANAYGLVIAGEDKDGRGNEKPAVPVVYKTPEDEAKALRAEIWKLLGPERGGVGKDWKEANNWLWANEVLDPGNPADVLPDLGIKRLKEVIEKLSHE